MITYPSTHGVFEEVECARSVRDVHEAGGQVYLDGANLNALVGLAKPGAFGADVSATSTCTRRSAIPHGGGGPGVGPIGVRRAPGAVPSRPSAATRSQVRWTRICRRGNGAGQCAPWGSAGILPIPWMYIRMMGAEGLREATERRDLVKPTTSRTDSSEHYPILYTAPNGTRCPRVHPRHSTA